MLDERTRVAIREALREIDPGQIAIERRLTTAERYAKMASMIAWAERTAAYRLRRRHPELSEVEALRLVRSKR
jgi:hypothetical protein